MQTSLRRTLFSSLAAPTLVLLLTAGAVAYSSARWVVGNAYDANLLNLAQAIATHVHATPDGLALRLAPEVEAAVRTDAVDRIYFRVRERQGRVLGGDAGLPLLDDLDALSSLPIPYTPVGREPTYPILPTVPARPVFRDLTHAGQPIRAVRLYRRQGTADFYVTVAETLGKRDEAMGRLVAGFSWAALLLLIAAGVAARFGIPSGLAPLARLERSLRARSGTDLSPIDPAGVPQEVREVIGALNGLLDRLRAANAQQRSFLQDAAHQLRTPLAGLQVQLELLESRPADAAARARLRHSVARITRLANQLLALARAEAGERLMADATEVDLAALIDAMVEDWVERADARQIDLGIEREPVRIAGDPTLLQELIANLMDNALKYGRTHGTVSLRCVRTGESVLIEVCDDGPGIPPVVREQVFERFYRHAGTAAASGSGLGLSIAREIVHSHGGRIDIDDGPQGCGTCVRVRLPLHPRPAP
ncbi:MAG: sensor histidine kinase [Thauera sp.]|nr:sensor histidine kinase [Thauera sp.]